MRGDTPVLLGYLDGRGAGRCYRSGIPQPVHIRRTAELTACGQDRVLKPVANLRPEDSPGWPSIANLYPAVMAQLLGQGDASTDNQLRAVDRGDGRRRQVAGKCAAALDDDDLAGVIGGEVCVSRINGVGINRHSIAHVPAIVQSSVVSRSINKGH